MTSPRQRFNSARLFGDLDGPWDLLPPKPSIPHLSLSPNLPKLSLSPAASVSPIKRDQLHNTSTVANLATFERNLNRLFITDESLSPPRIYPNRARVGSDLIHVRTNKHTVLSFLEQNSTTEAQEHGLSLPPLRPPTTPSRPSPC